MRRTDYRCVGAEKLAAGCLFRYRYQCLNARDEKNGKGGEAEIGGDIAAGEVYEDAREGIKGQGVGTMKELDALQRLTIGGASEKSVARIE